MSGWIGVDLDGTLATYGKFLGPGHIGEPIVPMVERVQEWIRQGREVKIFTARVYPIRLVRPDDDYGKFVGANDLERTAGAAVTPIQEWCKKHIGAVLPITCMKDYGMVELWDDRAVAVEMNTGRVLGGGRC